MMAMWKIFLYTLCVLFLFTRAISFWGQMGVHENNQLIEVRKMRQTCGNIIIVDSITISDCLYYYKSTIFFFGHSIFSMRKFLFCCARILGYLLLCLLRAISSYENDHLLYTFHDPS